MQVLADIAGDNAAHAIVLPVPAKWIQFIVSGAGTVRLADSTASATVGLPIAAGAGQMMPPIGLKNHYQSNEIYAYIPSGATLSIGYEP